jgi:hypothetical protein
VSLTFPSPEFDEAVAAVCHGLASDEPMRALNELLRADPAARDEYILRVELHSRLASDPDLFASTAADAASPFSSDRTFTERTKVIPLPTSLSRPSRRAVWAVAMAACLTLIVVLAGTLWRKHPGTPETSRTAIASLSGAANARWAQGAESHSLGAALEPGWLRLKSGLVQVVFYSGARLVIQGPAEVRLVSRHEAYCQAGLVSAEVPPQARGFCLSTPQMTVVDLGTAFGVTVKPVGAEVHVFKGEVEFRVEAAAKQSLQAGEAAAVEETGAVQRIPLNASVFAKAADLQRKWLAARDLRYREWRSAGARLDQDRSLLVHLEFENAVGTDGGLPGVVTHGTGAAVATVVGCQPTESRWPGRPGLEFRDIGDSVQLNVPGEFEALTLSAWVNVRGLDRPFNALFMCDGFASRGIHWQIRNDGVLDLGVLGPIWPDTQIFASPPVVTPEWFGRWVHVAAVVDGRKQSVTHYVNGAAVSHHTSKLKPPFRIGAAELGNWNIGEFQKAAPPFFIRHFSGSLDDFSLFHRALSDAEIRSLYLQSNPQP